MFKIDLDTCCLPRDSFTFRLRPKHSICILSTMCPPTICTIFVTEIEEEDDKRWEGGGEWEVVVEQQVIQKEISTEFPYNYFLISINDVIYSCLYWEKTSVYRLTSFYQLLIALIFDIKKKSEWSCLELKQINDSFVFSYR